MTHLCVVLDLYFPKIIQFDSFFVFANPVMMISLLLIMQPNTRIRITGITGYQDYPAVTLES